MDELLFRISRTFESLQVQLALTGERSKTILLRGSEITYENILIIWNSETLSKLKGHTQEIWENLLELLRQCNATLNEIIQSPIILIDLIKSKGSNIDRYSIAIGILLGFSVGLLLGIKLQKQDPVHKLMKSVVCNSYNGVDRIAFVDETIVPSITRSDHVLIQVKSAVLDKVDFQICSGYGYYVRKCLSKYYSNQKCLFPIVLGRSCSGIVVDIGCRVNKVEIGDEVWLALPVWCSGAISEYVVTNECFVGKKPTKIGFEGASSVAYSGSLAMQYLENAYLNATSALDKKVFIESCCTPVGCVLTQILKQWGAKITTSSSARAAPVAKAMGSTDNIIISISNDVEQNEEEKLLLKELEIRELKFDVVFITENKRLTRKHFQRFLNGKPAGFVICALPREFVSDKFHFIFGIVVCLCLRVQHFFQQLFSVQNVEEKWLDILYHYVENEQLQSVVDHIYPPQNIELAIAHKLSPDSIGSTVLKFT